MRAGLYLAGLLDTPTPAASMGRRGNGYAHALLESF